MRECKKCKQLKSLDNFEFTYYKSNKEQRRNICKICRNEARNLLDCRSPEKTRQKRLKKYGLTIRRYENLLKKQNNRCRICNEINTYGPWRDKLVVDHCHKTGKVRGLLCDKCNKGLGQFNDNIELLQNAIKYLKN